MVDVQFHFWRSLLANIATLVGMDRNHQIILELKWPPLVFMKRQVNAFPNVTRIILRKLTS